MILLYYHNANLVKLLVYQMLNLLKHFGLYFIMMRKVMNRPEKWSAFRKQLLLELEKIGLNSIGIVLFISFFVGGVVCIQTALNLENPLIPKYIIGLA